MKKFQIVLIFLVIAFISGLNCRKETVLVFEGPYRSWKEHRFRIDRDTHKCVEIPLKRIGSLITASCVILYDQPECKGRAIKIPSNTPCSIDLSYEICRMTDKAKSMSLCEMAGKDADGDW